MSDPDFEAKLNNALNQLIQGKSSEALHDLPEAAELLDVAQRLQGLVNTPEPSLAKGRQRLLAQVERLEAPRSGLFPRLISRPMLALTAVLILFATGMVFMTMRANMGNWPGISSPTADPTFTATPTKASLESPYAIPVLPVQANEFRPMGAPAPAPTPLAPRLDASPVHITALLWQLTDG